jgi:GDPmannose 4,6-dehydratase
LRKAFVTGITGQDGSYLAEFLLSKGYEVHGLIRRASTFNTIRLDHLYKDPHDPEARLFLHYGDLSDSEQTGNIIYNMKPDEIYHLGAQTHVRVSFDMPEYTGNIGALGTVRILESIRRSNHGARYYQASSSEMFGGAPPPQNEDTPLNPLSPYAAAKVYAYHVTNNYRDAYGIFACNGILFNHESPRRGEIFVTRKVARAVAAIKAHKERYLYLGNLDAKRDWGFAPEYVECMWRILQAEKPENYVVGTGQAHSVREFVAAAFSYVGLNSEDYTRMDQRYVRPLDPTILMADSAKASRRLGWKPKVGFEDLVKIMVDAEMRRIGLAPVGEGDEILRKAFPERWWTVD